MAQVPIVKGPSIGVGGTPALPRQNLSAPAAAFGASAAGQALIAAGATAEQVSNTFHQRAEQMAAIDNKTIADQRTVDNTAAASQFITEYKANTRGMAAYDNLGKAYEQLETMRAKGAEGLSPLAAQAYQSSSRNSLALAQSNLRDFAVTERKTSVINTSKAVVKTNQALMVGNPDDPAAQAAGREAIAGQLGFQGGQLGWSDEEGAFHLREALGAVYQGQIRTSIDAGNYPKAKDLFENHRDDMTAEQIVSVSGALKVGQNSFIANGFAQEVVNGAPQSEVDASPGGSWDSGLSLFRTDASGAIKSILGVEPKITSNKRDVATNARVGGSPTSEHLGGNAWDFTVPGGMSNEAAGRKLAAGLHAQGIPFDQVEVAGNHVHIGFGPKNRNEIINEKGQVLQRGGVNPTPSGVARPVLTPLSDPDQYRADMDAFILREAEGRFPDNPTLQTMAVQAAHARMNIQVEQLKAGQEATYTRLASAALDGNIQDVASLSTAYPGASGDLAALPPKYHYALEAATKRNANEITPSREANIVALRGMQATDPQAFVNYDLRQVDLPAGTRLATMKAQQDVRGQLQKQALKQQHQTTVNKVLTTTEAQAAMSSLGISKSQTPEDYFQFAGALDAELETYAAAHGNKAPDQKALNSMILSVTALHGKGWFTKGTPEFTVPKDERAAITALYQAKGLTPTERDIAYTYRRRIQRAP